MTTADPILRVEELTVGFDDHDGRFLSVVREVTFSIAPGQTLGLVGESGSGKTITALSLVRLLPARARVATGRILFDGRDVLQLDPAALRALRGAGIGFVFQEPAAALTPVLTIGDQIAEAVEAHGQAGRREARKRSVELLDTVRMPDAVRRAREYPHQLSGGLRQRAMLAIALACGPRMLVADEPTNALDVRIQAEILDLLRELRDRRGLALLLITHDFGVVSEMADTVAVMYAGRIVERSEAAAVLRNPTHPYTKGLLDSVPGGRAGERLRAIEGSVPPLGTLTSGCSFEPRCPSRLERCRSVQPLPVSVGTADTAAHIVSCHAAVEECLT
jgi:peptide/nickel transport system ATP-binding protein